MQSLSTQPQDAITVYKMCTFQLPVNAQSWAYVSKNEQIFVLYFNKATIIFNVMIFFPQLENVHIPWSKATDFVAPCLYCKQQ